MVLTALTGSKKAINVLQRLSSLGVGAFLLVNSALALAEASEQSFDMPKGSELAIQRFVGVAPRHSNSRSISQWCRRDVRD